LRTKFLLGVLLLLIPALGLVLQALAERHAGRTALVLDDLTQTGQAVAVVTDVFFDEAVRVAQLLAG
jgi:hypothetical protein